MVGLVIIGYTLIYISREFHKKYYGSQNPNRNYHPNHFFSNFF